MCTPAAGLGTAAGGDDAAAGEGEVEAAGEGGVVAAGGEGVALLASPVSSPGNALPKLSACWPAAREVEWSGSVCALYSIHRLLVRTRY